MNSNLLFLLLSLRSRVVVRKNCHFFLSMLLLALLAVSSVFLLTTKHFSFDLEEWFDQDTEQDAPPFLGSLPGKVTYSGTPFSASSRN